MARSQHKYPEHETGPVYSRRDVRQSDMVLRKRRERGVFVAGLFGAVVLAIVIVLIGMHLGRAYSEHQAQDDRTQVRTTEI
jgi:uncharacterized membrane protein